MRFRLLGAVEAEDSGVPVALGGPRQRAVLAALLLRAGRPAGTGYLVDAVWESPPATPESNIRTYVAGLRRCLGGSSRLVTTSGGYVLRLRPDELDVSVFDELAGQAEDAARERDFEWAAKCCEQALGLWRGEPFEDLTPGPALRAEATRLNERHLTLLELRAEAAVELGRAESVVGELRGLRERHPLRERLSGLLMRALARCGRHAEALQVFRDLRRTLVDELGIEPGAEVRQIHQELLEADPAPPAPAATAPVPRLLPAEPAGFVGRASTLAALSRGLRERAVLLLDGTAGIGKTWLALHWAHRHTALFPDGQLFADLRGFDPAAPPVPASVVLHGFLDALGVQPERIPVDLNARIALYRSLMADRRTLVVLDNAADTSQVTPLLPGSSAGAVLITSRAKLVGLVTTHGARPIAVDVLDHDEARELLTNAVGVRRLNDEPAAVDQLLRHCAGLPLALGITAARAATRPELPLAALAGELRDHSTRLDALDTGEADLSLRAVLSSSHDAVSSAAATAFGLLALAGGPDIGAPAAASMTGGPATRVLRELENAHLVQQHRPGRYRMHDLVRLYGRERAGLDLPHATRAAAVRRLLDHHLHTAERATLLLYPQRDPLDLPAPAEGVVPEAPTTEDEAFAWFGAEVDVLVRATDLAVEHGWDAHAWQLPWTLATYLDRTGRWDDLFAVLRTGLGAATRLSDVDGQARTRRMLGQVCVRLGRHDDAHAHLRKAVEHYGELGNQLGQAHTGVSLSWVCEQQGNHREALAHAHQALDRYRAVGHRFGYATALNIIGWCHAQIGDHRAALDRCVEAVGVYRELGNRAGLANALDSVAYAHHRLGDHERAIACFHEAIDVYRELEDRPNEATTLVRLGDTHLAAGDPGAACTVWRAALRVYDGLGHPETDALRRRLAEAEQTRTAHPSG
jgi:DNA-binding SARP family transcriptional activator